MSQNPFAAPEAPPSPAPRPVATAALKTADPWSRFFARTVDGFLLGGTWVPGLAIHALMGSPDLEFEPALFLLAYSPSAALCAALCGWQWYRMSIDGTTAGKRMADVRVVDRRGRPPGFFMGVAVRSWALQSVQAVFGGLGGVVSLLDALMVFSDEGRTLHDRLAQTRVVRGRVPRPGEGDASAEEEEDFDLD